MLSHKQQAKQWDRIIDEYEEYQSSLRDAAESATELSADLQALEKKLDTIVAATKGIHVYELQEHVVLKRRRKRR